MIIPEGTEQSPKVPNREPEQTVEPAQAPPAYPGEGSYQAGTSSTQPLYGPPPTVVSGESAKKRFFKAFVLAILIWTLLAILTGSVAEVGRQTGNTAREHKDAATAWPRPADGKVLHCVRGPLGWSTSGGRTSLSFELERSSDVLYFLSRGIKSTGNIVVIQDERSHEPDTVHVDIVARHYTPSYLHNLAVCALERKRGQQGIGIFTPTQWRSKNSLPDLEFEITVRLPKISTNQPLPIHALETNLPNFAQHVGDLLNSVKFGSLSLHGTNGDVNAYAVYAGRISIKTSNGYIRGHYEALDSLILQTSNAIIETDAFLYSNDSHATNRVIMRTSNYKISSTLSLMSASGAGGTFAVESTTSNARSTMGMLALPVDSTLNLVVQSSNAPVVVSVPSAYEGSFLVKTSVAQAAVVRARSTDPSGRDRSALWFEEGTTTFREGRVEWVEEHVGAIPATQAAGNIIIRTTNSPAALYL